MTTPKKRKPGRPKKHAPVAGRRLYRSEKRDGCWLYQIGATCFDVFEDMLEYELERADNEPAVRRAMKEFHNPERMEDRGQKRNSHYAALTYEEANALADFLDRGVLRRKSGWAKGSASNARSVMQEQAKRIRRYIKLRQDEDASPKQVVPRDAHTRSDQDKRIAVQKANARKYRAEQKKS